MNEVRKNARRLVIVSNRLPFSVTRSGTSVDFSPASGGLVSGLASYLASPPDTAPRDYLWVGWPGSTIEEEFQPEVTARALKEYHSSPVFLSDAEMDQFYLGFCNKTIWPLFHSFASYAAYEEEMWSTYKAVNERFCEALCAVVRPGDLVWVHDYHLMLLPKLLKDRLPACQTGFFLHIPFPSYELFRLLPSVWRREILQGVLGADLVGFHTHEYTQHFLQSVLRILGHANTFGQILLPDRAVHVDTFPMGIDYRLFADAAASAAVGEEASRLRASLNDNRIILSVDRLDYTKGILDRLEGYGAFLEVHPEWHAKIALVLVVVPSRIGVDQYDLMKRKLEELVGRINGKFGQVGWTPVVYQYRAVEFTSLVALYVASDIAMVTPLRDGMNLVAKEFVATRTSGSGVLILSEMAGAAKELGEAVLVNPNHRGEIAAAIGEALGLPPEEQARRVRLMQARLQRYTVHRWADDFLGELVKAEGTRIRFGTKPLDGDVRTLILRDYRKARSRLIMLDYDGTLVPFAPTPSAARPGERLLSLIATLVRDRANTLAIVSGRDRRSLEEWFGALPVHLIAEHGCLSRRAGGEWKITKNISGEWKERLLPMLRQFADRVPGSSVEEKEFALVWHYREADSENGVSFAHELADNLTAVTGNIDVQVIQGNKAIEVRLAGVDKGSVARELLAEAAYDFVLAVGDDTTDEDMFAALPETAHSVKVGGTRSIARYSCTGVDDVHRLLHLLADLHFPSGIPRGVVTRTLDFLMRVTGRWAS